MTESDTSGGDEERGTSRGAGFPVMDLATAVDLIHKIGEHGGEFGKSMFAQYLGHSTANSGPYRTKVASLRDWSLVTTQGGRVLLTDLGKAVAKSPDPIADETLLRSAFDSCKIFKAFYDNTAKGVALKRDTLGRAAVFDHKVSAKSQDKFASMLVDSAVTVGLATNDEAGTITFQPASVTESGALRRDDAEPDSQQETSEPDDVDGRVAVSRRLPPTPPPPLAVTGSVVPVLLRQVWRTATGEVVLAVHATDPLPASAFALVGQAVQAAEDLAKSIGLSAVEGPVGDDAA